MRTRRTVVVLVSGKAGSGKSTFADMLQSKIQDIPGLTLFRYSLAKPLKDVAEIVLGWDKKKDEAGRRLLQELGRVGREYNPNVWVAKLLEQMEKKQGFFPFNFVIVDDWRYPNEFEYLKKNPILDVYTVRVSGKDSYMPGNTASDSSETSLPDGAGSTYDSYIVNGNGLEELETKADEVVKILTQKYILE
jgi:hypothetical protein